MLKAGFWDRVSVPMGGMAVFESAILASLSALPRFSPFANFAAPARSN